MHSVRGNASLLDEFSEKHMNAFFPVRFADPGRAMSTETVSHFNPFPGLRPFQEEEEHLFFGRESQVDAILDKLATARLLAVMGVSGSGKSSLVNCGLIPALRGGLMAEAGPAWKVAALRPGSNPLKALALALDAALFTDDDTGSGPGVQNIEATLRRTRRGVLDVFEKARQPEEANLLVVVDHFEEVFRFDLLRAGQAETDPGNERDDVAFVNLLLQVQKQTTSPVYVALTMRSDFLEDCRQFDGLPEAINKGQYLVPRMTREERRAAIAGPVAVGGATIAPALLTRLVNDIGDHPDQLSILQHGLNTTWTRWLEHENGKAGKKPLALEHYEALGTLDRALDAHAEEGYAELGSARKRQVCEKIFKALTYKGADMRGVRRPTKLVTLCALVGAHEADSIAEVIEVIDVFRKPNRAFLMPPAPETLRAETVIDLSHESLMRIWGRLKQWVDEEAESARMYRRLAEAALLYEAGQARFWRDPDLQLAEDWREANSPTRHWALQYHPGYEAAMGFLDASLAMRDEEARAAVALQQRELDRAEALATTKAETARRYRTFFLIAAVLAVFAMLTTLFAMNSRQMAQNSLTEAQRERQAAVEARDSLQLALDHAMTQRLEAERQLMYAGTNGGETMDPNDPAGPALVDAEQQVLPTVAVQDPASEAQPASSSPAPSQAQPPAPEQPAPARSAAQQRRAVGRALANNAVSALRRGNKTQAAMLAREAFMMNQAGGGSFTSAMYDALRQTLNALQPQLGGPRNVPWVAPGGHASPGETPQAASPNGQVQATGHVDGTVRVETTGGVTTLRGHRGPVTAVAFSPDGTLLATGSADRTVRLWKIDPATGKPSTRPYLVLREHTTGITDLYFAEGGAAVVTRSADRTVRHWWIAPESLGNLVCGVMGRGFSLTRAEWNRHVGSSVDYSEHKPCPE